VFRDLLGIDITSDLPKISAWAQTLLALPEVQQARVPELPDLFRQLITKRNAWAQTLLR